MEGQEKNTPTDIAHSMMNEGKSKDQILQNLKSQGFDNQQINEALNQAEMKQGVQPQQPPQQQQPQQGGMSTEQYQPSDEMQVSEIEKEDIPVPAPTPSASQQPQQSQMQTMPSPAQMAQSAYTQQPQQYQQPEINYDDVQSLVEEVIDEKWKEFMGTLGDITSWKTNTDDDMESIKQEVLRIRSRFDNLQASILGKVDEYSKGINEIGTEMKALEKVFEKILEPLTSNIKELSKITDELRKHKK